MKTTRSKLLANTNCCVCGLTNCRQSVDHRFISLKEFSHLINSAKMPNTELDEIKQKITQFYNKLKADLIAILEADSNRMHQQLNKYYFPHIDQTKLNINQLCQYANNHFVRLPNKRVAKIMSTLKVRHSINDQLNKKLQFQQLKQDILSFISEFEKKKQTQKIKIYLPFSSIAQKAIPKIKLKRSQSDISNPQQIDEVAAKTYSWKNVTIKSRTKALQLSNKNITDMDLLREMPAISSFKNIKQFQIRNNKITSFSCKLIGSNMSHVRTIDIRCNNVGDEGVIAIIKAIPQLKSFMISQTKCTGLSALAIYTHLKDIQVLWCEHNSVDDENALLIGELTKLKVLSFAGNGLSQQTGDALRKIFCNKGYVIV